MTGLDRNAINILALVASDASYDSTRSKGAKLGSFPDSRDSTVERGFPPSLTAKLSANALTQDYFTRVDRTSPSGIATQKIVFNGWEIAANRTLDDKNNGF